MASSLDYQIAQTKKELQLRKLAVKVRSQDVISTTHDKLASPTALCVAVGAGFLIGEMSDRPKEQTESSGEKKSATNTVIKVLRLIAGVQSASSFAKHL
ncbi:hypothetical protein U0358_08205 [Idiomarina sp. PL1-037]|jgi:hypothetical protein|uniref:hypothetical protein n=1 Tax=unclassified Idiomarina TaxID=2614829 RepID=UPI00294B23C8|nr:MULTISPECIES: hypothetical protein [unclassified Idiomarina]MDV6327194.1 hypothetical protein [Idiomarina sp. Sol25]WQC52041.1 hypothetical protein U0358_08205 [Idiomarina sp. PL1-037]